jgi:hypothetical protein
VRFRATFLLAHRFEFVSDTFVEGHSAAFGSTHQIFVRVIMEYKIYRYLHCRAPGQAESNASATVERIHGF